MMLQEIIANNKKKSWLRLCTINGIDKWSLIDHLDEPVYSSKHLIIKGLEVETRACLLCKKPFDLGFYKGNFIVSNICDCGKDNTCLMTKEKLLIKLSEEQVKIALMLVNNKKKRGLPNTIEFWLEKGFSLEQATEEITKIQKNRSSKSPAAQKGTRGYSPRTKEYWIKKGYTEIESINKIKEIQTTNGLAFYKNKYGELGEELFNERIKKWLESAGNKKMIANRSKKSLELFEQLGIGDFGLNERTVRGKEKVHRVDYLHNKKIIEFYGDYWHGNPKIYSNDALIRKKKIIDVWQHDAQKVKDLIENGYEVLIIWENEYKNFPKEILQKCKDFIQ